MITLLHGPAELIRAETLAQIRAQIASDPELVELNTTRLEGRQLTLGELQNACDTLPFLADRRLVIVDGLLNRLATQGRARPKSGEAVPAEAETPDDDTAPEVSKGQAKAFVSYLDQVPASTELVLMEGDTIGSGPMLRRLQELAREERARVVLCEKPRKNDLPEWIRSRARLHGVKLDPAAVADLAEFVGDELRQLDQELIKLADYGAGRTITREEVRRLVAATRAANVFELVDALGLGDAPTAGRVLKHALDVDGEQPLRLLGMIARQYRLLIRAKALQAEGARPPEMARTLNVADWTVPRLLTQASRHSFARLERAMEYILAADEAIKTGRLTDREAMDVLLAELMSDR